MNAGVKEKVQPVCRLCLNTLILDCAVKIFENKDNNFDLRTLILKYLHLELNADDCVSKSVCQDCFDHLEDFHHFYRNVYQKQKSLRRNFDFLEVKCERVEDDDAEKKDEIPVQDSLYHLETAHLRSDELDCNNENDPVEKMDTNLFPSNENAAEDNLDTILITKLKTEELEFSSDDDTPLTELCGLTKVTLNEDESSSSTLISNEGAICVPDQCAKVKTKIKIKRKKPIDSTEPSPKLTTSAQALILEDCDLRCELCSIEIGNFPKLKQHFDEMHHEMVYIMCCNKRYAGRKNIGRHLHRHRDPDKFKCTICNKQFFSTKYLKSHLKVVHNPQKKEKIKCDFCDMEFKLEKSFEKHMGHHYSGEIKETLKPGQRAQCNQCTRSFSSTTRLKQHCRIMHAVVLPYQCDACLESFLTKLEEDNHRLTCRNRKLAEKNVQDSQDTICKICCKIFSSTTRLKQHCRIMHAVVLPYQCDACLESFLTKLEEDNHRLTCRNRKLAEKNVQDSQDTICKICCKMFPSLTRLRAHIASIHENVHNFICEECGKKFKLKASLEKHQQTHQGIVDAPAQCETCGRWLKNQSSLRVHKYMHDNSFNKCSLCEHVSTTRRALRLHVKKVHRSEHNFHCQYCEKSFKNSNYLEEHMAIHTGAQLYACPHCGKESRSRSNMYAHVKRMHPEEWLKNQLARSHDPTAKSHLIKLK